MMLMCLALTVSLQAGFAVGCSDGSELCLDWIESLPILWFGFRRNFLMRNVTCRQCRPLLYTVQHTGSRKMSSTCLSCH